MKNKKNIIKPLSPYFKDQLSISFDVDSDGSIQDWEIEDLEYGVLNDKEELIESLIYGLFEKDTQFFGENRTGLINITKTNLNISVYINNQSVSDLGIKTDNTSYDEYTLFEYYFQDDIIIKTSKFLKQEVFKINPKKDFLGVRSFFGFKNENIKLKSIKKEPILDGSKKIFSDSGVLISEIIYKNGKKNGLCKYYFPNGQLESEGIFEKDLKWGVWKEYNSNGVLITEVNYSNDLKDGLYKNYCMGFLELEGQFKEDKQVGIWKTYENGVLKKQNLYEDGNYKSSFDNEGNQLNQ